MTTTTSLDLSTIDHGFIEDVQKASGQRPGRCIQCGKCTAGCPAQFVYDIPVNAIMHAVQQGLKEKVLTSRSIWLCAMCQTCSARCPMEIDVAAVMETLRSMAWAEGYANREKTKPFFEAFLSSVQKSGRVHEMGMMVSYMLKTGRFTTDIDIAPKAAGKLSLLPHTIRNKAAVDSIISRYKRKRGL
ncbi:heterodisulfide reductase subunit C [Oceanidesulfovibrio indonesiensis]|uniref:Heterodisulfide reductase subunit C n=1 Tax=Oceanidesulfovibrio indonesiensis TaxID=54767 RepID=A0A7M3MG54_9BACT|nr:4Fe-4S dicluster domain-containing protein [Oceanidesulfovibrio indonesiensis]TVM17869.1 heterodisulfide reductase subunit C [Oceanidesulfovibrio indonesiensis]